WIQDVDPGRRRQLVESALSVLGNIHSIDWRNELAFLDRPEFGPTGTRQQIEEWHAAYRCAAQDNTSPTTTAASKSVREHCPEDKEIVLTWGDARLGNVMYGLDFSVQAALDWELATLASPEMDVSWWLWLQRHHTEGLGIPLPAGIPDAGE